MNMNIILFSLFFIITFHSNYLANCTTHSLDYRRYVIEVLNHLCHQNGWKSMPHIRLKYPSVKNNVINIVNEKVTVRNYEQVYHDLAHVLNCRYTEILWYFDTMISYIIDKCYMELNMPNFNNCAINVFDAVKYSAIMFNKLFSAMNFMRSINLKNINSTKNNPTTIVDEIKMVKEFISLIMVQRPSGLPTVDKKDILDEFLKIKISYDTLDFKNILRQLILKNNIFTSINKSDVPQYLQIMYDENAFNNFNNLNINVGSIKKLLLTFYKQIIQDVYEDIGFPHLLDYDTPKFTPSTVDFMNKTERIQFLNSIITKDGWKMMKHITIIHKNEYLKVDDIFTPVNKTNENHKRLQISQLMRCRYTEILHNYEYFLKAFLNLCWNEKKNNTTNHFVYCVIQLYNSLNKSTIMLDRMFTALLKIKKMSGLPTVKSYPLLIERFFESFLNFIKELFNKYQFEADFNNVNSDGNGNIANAFLNEVTNLQGKIIVQSLVTMKNYNTKICLFKVKSLELDSIIDILLCLDYKNCKTPLGHFIDPLYEKANTYYENIIRNDCENIGF
ncbi:uncharacterized protein LOC126896870 [Daktulosphaira vitifoliae]|uniref:uncharacterized protein LOC126896870 n=1 Tax=Daktulosphaira vitifoliae TaxID=58002 RepID=UPI0021A9E2D7|nr:uncharacterized protein LOC126896870 [Daktulosphaira vitifoliae]